MSAVAGLVIATWLTFSAAGWTEDKVLTWIPDSAMLAGLVIIGLIALDTVLPLPATIVMLGSGSLFGPVVGGSINATGLLVAALCGYTLGRLLPSRFESTNSIRPVLIATTRGLPVLSESLAISAGVVDYPLRSFTWAALVGGAAVGLVYATAGWLARDHWSLIVVACALAAGSYVVAVRISRYMGG